MPKTDRSDTATAAVSNEVTTAEPGPVNGQGESNGSGEGEIQAPFRLGLSGIMQEKISLDLARTLHQIAMGIGDISASEVAKLGISFHVIDGVYIDEFEDRKTGELKSKVVFRLECSDGVVRTIMQSAARPRRLLAEACEQARLLGARFKAGPYKFGAKETKSGPSDAWIMIALPGCQQVIY